MSTVPDNLTFEQFCAIMESNNKERIEFLHKQYQFAIKERERLREKDRRKREKRKKLKEALPPEQRPKIGRPRKHVIKEQTPVFPAPPSETGTNLQ